MKTLPSHTTRYFAQQAYWLYITTGKEKPRKYKTTQGVEIEIHYNKDNKEMICLYTLNGKDLWKAEKIRKNWLY